MRKLLTHQNFDDISQRNILEKILSRKLAFKKTGKNQGGVCSHKAGVKPRGGGKKYQNMNKKMKNELHRDFFSRQMTFQKMGMARGV